jgi:hypothetical protein
MQASRSRHLGAWVTACLHQPHWEVLSSWHRVAVTISLHACHHRLRPTCAGHSAGPCVRPASQGNSSNRVDFNVVRTSHPFALCKALPESL